MSKETLNILPRPTLGSGTCASDGIVSEGIIDWTVVRHMWVHPVSLERDGRVSRIYAPCVVFVDNTWVPVGPMGTLADARRVCHRWAAIHDLSVSDMTRPRPPAISPEGNLADVSPTDIGHELPGDPWHYDKTENRFRLNLSALGVNLAIKVMNHGQTLEQQIAALTPGLDRIEATFRACDVIQPHYIRPWMAKVREGAVFWLREMDGFHADHIETEEDSGRALADEVRKEGVTITRGLVRLKERILHFYKDMRWEDGTLVEDRAERAERAFNAGFDRLVYFAGGQS